MYVTLSIIMIQANVMILLSSLVLIGPKLIIVIYILIIYTTCRYQLSILIALVPWGRRNRLLIPFVSNSPPPCMMHVAESILHANLNIRDATNLMGGGTLTAW